MQITGTHRLGRYGAGESLAPSACEAIVGFHQRDNPQAPATTGSAHHITDTANSAVGFSGPRPTDAPGRDQFPVADARSTLTPGPMVELTETLRI